MKFLPWYPTAAAGPTCHVFCPSSELVAVGKMNDGPAASSQLPTKLRLGDSAKASTVSPNAVTRFSCPAWLRNGVEENVCMTGRVIRFQSSFTLTDISG